jgi:hypothetical protein
MGIKETLSSKKGKNIPFHKIAERLQILRKIRKFVTELISILIPFRANVS